MHLWPQPSLNIFAQTYNIQVCSMPVDFDWLWLVFSVFCRKNVISTGLLSVLHVTSTLLWTPWLSTICLSTSWGSSRSQMPGYVLLGLVWPPCANRQCSGSTYSGQKLVECDLLTFICLIWKIWNQIRSTFGGKSKKQNRDFSLTHLNKKHLYISMYYISCYIKKRQDCCLW